MVDVDAVYMEAHARLQAGVPLDAHHERVVALLDHAGGCSSCAHLRGDG